MLSACGDTRVQAWLQGAPAVLPSSSLQIWNTSAALDVPLARWRRMQNDIPMVRKSMTEAQLIEALADAWRGDSEFPDVVIAPSNIVQYCHVPGLWRTFGNESIDRAAGVAAGFTQCTDVANELFAVPISVDPIGIWYHAELMHQAQLPRDPDLLAAQWPDDWQQFYALLGQLHTNTPMINAISSVYDDIYRTYVMRLASQSPATVTNLEQLQQIHATCTALAQTTNTTQARHFDGRWFDMVQREQAAVLVGGRSLKTALQRTQIAPESAWRVTIPPTGFVCGESMVAAVPATARNLEGALQCVTDLYHDDALQLSISTQTQRIPARIATHAALNEADVFCGGQFVDALWCEGAQRMTAAVRTANQCGEIRYCDAVFADFWGGLISEQLLGQRLTDITTQAPQFVVTR